MIIAFIVFALINVLMFFIRRYLFKTVSISCGRLLIKAKTLQPGQKVKNAIISLCVVAVMALIIYFFSTHLEKAIVPLWLLAIMCGIISGRFLTLLLEFSYIRRGFYENGLILNSGIYKYTDLKSYMIQKRRDSLSITLSFRNGENEAVYITKDESNLLAEIMSNHSIENHECD